MHAMSEDRRRTRGREETSATPAGTDKGTPDGEWTEARNERRCALIDKGIDGTLTREEAAELRQLQRAMLRYRRGVAPLPLEDARRLHDELLAKAGRRKGGV
jgi:hypothetical protein